MNKHFEDALYYLRRAGEHAKAGLQEELEPVEAKLREVTGREREEEVPGTRLDRLQHELKGIERRAEGESKQAVKKAQTRIKQYRGGGSSTK